MSLIIDGTNGVTFNDTSLQGAAASPYVLKNRIINGAMVIDQRNNGASVTATNTGTVYNTVDRWNYYASVGSKFTLQQNQGSVTPPAGFTNYLGITSSAATTINSGDIYVIQQFIEGYNVSDLAWGTANAKTVTLSFWVRSSLTGTFGIVLQNSDDTRAYPINYTISSANTWEQKTITIPGDTTGTWLTGNNAGLKIRWQLAMGSSYTGTSGAWTSSTVYGVTGATNILSTNGATFYITGVQLEIGSTATPFERRLYNQELANCQRYYYSMGGNAVYEHFASISQTEAADGRGILFLPVSMRTQPTIGQSGSFVISSGSNAISGTYSAGTTMYVANTTNFAGLQNIGFDFFTGTAGSYNIGAGAMWILRANNSTATRLTFSAEL